MPEMKDEPRECAVMGRSLNPMGLGTVRSGINSTNRMIRAALYTVYHAAPHTLTVALYTATDRLVKLATTCQSASNCLQHQFLVAV
jgi:hypothetical protein